MKEQSKVQKLPTQIIGNIGLFHVCYELSRRGFNVVPTSRNTRAVDIIVGAADFSKHVTVQVKATTINMGIHVGSKKKFPTKADALRATSLADFWVYVRVEPKEGCAVKRVTVWRGNDGLLLREMPSNWWFNPWDFPASVDAKVKKKWEKLTGDGGWDLIGKSLSTSKSMVVKK